jgi:hypothetical protein
VLDVFNDVQATCDLGQSAASVLSAVTAAASCGTVRAVGQLCSGGMIVNQREWEIGCY